MEPRNTTTHGSYSENMGKSTDGKKRVSAERKWLQERESRVAEWRTEDKRERQVFYSGFEHSKLIIKFLESANLLKHFTVYQKRFYTFSTKDVETDQLSLCVPFESSTSRKLMHVIKRFFF